MGETDGNHWSEDIPECIPVVRKRSDVCGWDTGQKHVSCAYERECAFLCVLVFGMNQNEMRRERGGKRMVEKIPGLRTFGHQL